MKAIVYYSLGGHTKKAVEERYEGDFYRLKGKIKIPRGYWQQMIYLGMFATLNSKLKYEPLDIDFDQYDEIVLASPVWAFTIVPFMKKFLLQNKFTNKKVTVLITHEGGPGNAIKHFSRYLHHSNTIVDQLDIKCGSSYQERKKKK